MMIEVILLCIITIAVFTLPGACMVVAIRIEQFRCLFVLSLSLGLFAVCLAISGNLGLHWEQFAWLYIGAVLACMGAAGLSLYGNGLPAFFNQHFKWRDLAATCGLVAAYGVYIILIGPYDELPADYYRHLERIQLMRSDLLDGESNLAVFHSGLNGRYWYYLYAMAWHLSGTTLDQSIHFYSWFNGALLLVTVYLFSSAWLSRRFKRAALLALVTCSLFVLHQGVVSFAFIRYYALSATMLSLPVYFLVILVFVRHIEVGLSARHLVAAILCLSTPLLYHYQEALFSLVIIWLLGLYYSAGWIGLRLYEANGGFELPERLVSYWRNTKNQRQGLWMFVVLTVAFLALHVYLFNTVTRADVDHSKVISLQHLLPFIQNLYILNPSYQFYQTIALWGVVVYVGFFLAIRRFLTDPYVLMGMLSPLFTVFNPVFVDFFLRIRDVHALYRLGYMIPLAMAGACLMWFLLSDWRQQGWGRRCMTAASLAVLAAALFSFDARFLHSEYSRLPTLLKLEENRSARHWEDLVAYMNTVEQPTEIYTDPVTGYMLTAYTHHRSVRYKFTDAGLKPINFDEYAGFPLKSYRGGILVINLRDGGRSATGALSNHWPAGVLKVSRYYSAALLDHVRNHPDHFPLLWESDDIEVYRIHP